VDKKKKEPLLIEGKIPKIRQNFPKSIRLCFHTWQHKDFKELMSALFHKEANARFFAICSKVRDFHLVMNCTFSFFERKIA